MTQPHAIVRYLTDPAAYRPEVVSRVEVIETHISWVFLTDQFAYKVKKPVQLPFLDYSTLERRRKFCFDELRLNQRFAPEMYVGVVALVQAADGVRTAENPEAADEVLEYAVKMQRFAADALLATRLAAERVNTAAIISLGKHIAAFHAAANRHVSLTSAQPDFGSPAAILRDALDNLDALETEESNTAEEKEHLTELRNWTESFWSNHQQVFEQRRQLGFIRECHGDLHCGNIVDWQGELTPFDGIEFNQSFHWIDVLSDIAFLAMDLTARQHLQFANLCVNAYLEQTGDYQSLAVLRWYMVYRALVRAKVAGLVMSQHRPMSNSPDVGREDASGACSNATSAEQRDTAFHSARAERLKLLRLAVGFAAHTIATEQKSAFSEVSLWLTHGLSGCGKSTWGQQVVKRWGAIRIRSDVERKRMFSNVERMGEGLSIYSADASERTYARLLELAASILAAGYSVVVDATFLKHEQRVAFAELAKRYRVPFRILAPTADIATLETRIRSRLAAGQDPSEANIDVLHQQLTQLEALSEDEATHRVNLAMLELNELS